MTALISTRKIQDDPVNGSPGQVFSRVFKMSLKTPAPTLESGGSTPVSSNTKFGREKLMIRVIEFLPPSVETWTEFLHPGFPVLGPAQH